MNKNKTNTQENTLKLNQILLDFDEIISTSIDATQDGVEVLLTNENRLKEILKNKQDNNNSNNTIVSSDECKELETIVKSLINVILTQKKSNSKMVKSLQDEQHLVQNLNDNLIEENKILRLDHLTELGNRHALHKDIKSRIDNNIHFSLSIIDLDDFKQINTKYGHNGGDIILKFFANYMTSMLTNNSTIYRLGGEEFIIISDIEEQELTDMLNHILKKLKKTTLTTKSNQNIHINLTFSAGVSSTKDQILTNEIFHTISEDADKKLFIAKHNGKAQIKD